MKYLYRTISLAALFAASPVLGSPKMEKKIYKDIPYTLVVPEFNNANTSKHPLILFFHGRDERGSDNISHLTYGLFNNADSILNPKRPGYVPTYFLAPQLPKSEWWTSLNPKDFGAPLKFSAQPQPAMKKTLDLVKELIKSHKIDPKRIYVIGLSIGGFAVWDALAREPDLFAAAIPICGGGDPKISKKIAHIPIWAFHGTDDPLVPMANTTKIINEIIKHGGHPHYSQLKGVGHGAWIPAFKNPKLWEWLFMQSK